MHQAQRVLGVKGVGKNPSPPSWMGLLFKKVLNLASKVVVIKV